jgi:hypothetical protein
MSSETTEAIVLQDAEGAYYVLPRAVVDAYRIADEQGAEVELALGGEVCGYAIFSQPIGNLRTGAWGTSVANYALSFPATDPYNNNNTYFSDVQVPTSLFTGPHHWRP